MKMAPSESPKPRAITLCRTRHGIATACSCCGRVQFSLGNAWFMSEASEITVMLVRLEPFRRFRSSARQVFQQVESGQRARVRRHVVHMGGEGTAFLFHDGEMSELCDLLEGAHLALRQGSAVHSRTRASDVCRDALH